MTSNLINIHDLPRTSRKPLTEKHIEVINKLELMLEEGIPKQTMSELASKLKISLRTLYEISPSKNHLIRMTVDRILMRLGKEALDEVSNINSPIEALKKYSFSKLVLVLLPLLQILLFYSRSPLQYHP